MATLAIERLHARYTVGDPADADRLDACLRRVVDGELDDALLGVPVPTADHVCVPSVRVGLELDTSGTTAAMARTWARGIAAAVEVTIAAGTGVVVFPRTLDALVDLVVSSGRGDLVRGWAWRQVGLPVPGDHGRGIPEAVATALASQPDLAPAALVAAARLGPVVLAPTGWVLVARAVQSLAGGTGRSDHGRPGTGAPVPTHADPRAASIPAVVTRVLGSPVGQAMGGATEASAADRRALARLLVVCETPYLVRSEALVTAVAAALAPPRPAPVAHDADAGPGGPGPAHPPGTDTGPLPSTDLATADRRADDACAVDGPSVLPCPPDAVVTGFGGLAFLIRVVDDLDLVTGTAALLPARPFPWVLRQLAVGLSGCDPGDPVVTTLTGRPDPDEPPATPDETSTVGALAVRAGAWLRDRLRLEPDEGFDRLWRRRATIVADPGWIEVGFSLDDVDTAVRSAGLDLDPGFVWWLGAVVRYRYA